MYGSALSIDGERALISPDQMHTRNFMVGKIQQFGNKNAHLQLLFHLIISPTKNSTLTKSIYLSSLSV